MPWKETDPMKEKIKLISAYEEGYGITELSRAFEVSRKTIYKIIRRYEKEGVDGLKEYSRKPHSNPYTTSPDIVEEIIALKKKHRNWGPVKLISRLKKIMPGVKWPSASTAGNWLKKNNLVKPRRKRMKVPSYNEAFAECVEPNDIWSIDYKGEFKTKDGLYCYPLTISDNVSRYLLSCKGMYGTRHDESKKELERVFREYGIPYVIRSDNGVPFASASITGLSRLSVWWIKLGIFPERIAKGKPQQNGRHERMHRTLKDEISDRIAKDLVSQQRDFEVFREEYNTIRPHASLGNKSPRDVYVKSNRRYPQTLGIVDYEYGDIVRSVRSSGEVKFRGELYYLSSLLRGERVCFKEEEDGIFTIYFSFYPIARFNMCKKKIESLEGK